LAHCFEGRGRSLDDQKPFARFFYLVLPAINRYNLRDDVDAGGQTFLYNMPRNFPSFFF